MTKRTLLIALAFSATTATGITATTSAVRNDDDMIHACYARTTGTLRIVDTSAEDTCRKSEVSISWNQTGPQGEPGPQGPAGPPGEKGEQGEPGATAAARRWYADRDGDGHGDWYDHVDSAARPDGYVANNSDCNDDRADVHPGGAQAGRGWDFDCDGLADDTNIVYYVDQDGDGRGDSSRPRTGFESAPDYERDGVVRDAHDCNDADAKVTTQCWSTEDNDGDGHRIIPRGDDCDDFNPRIYPGKLEVHYDGLNNDCDPSTWDVEPYVHDVGRHDPVKFGPITLARP